jgi:hypothetical protein
MLGEPSRPNYLRFIGRSPRRKHGSGENFSSMALYLAERCGGRMPARRKTPTAAAENPDAIETDSGKSTT